MRLKNTEEELLLPYLKCYLCCKHRHRIASGFLALGGEPLAKVHGQGQVA